MAEEVRESNGFGMGMVMAILLVLVVVLMFFMFGRGMMNQSNGSGQIVPDQVDVNLNSGTDGGNQ